MNTSHKILLFLLFMISIGVSAQNTAQAEDFVDLGNRPVSTYTGRVEKEIPICNINKFGFNIHVGLHYSSQGFKPSKRESIVGHNWFLNTGGDITRIINGVEDERQDDRHPTDGYDEDNPIDKINIDGYYTGIKKHQPSQADIERLKTTNSLYDTIAGHLYVGPQHDPYELSPDVFQFNFGGGISGKFVINLDGSVKVVPNGPYHLKIDISGFATQRAETGVFDHRKPNDSQIVITTDNGYKYYFGGDYNYLQWISDDLYLAKHKSLRPVINTWNLAKIVAPNGYEVTYSYYPYDINYEEREDQTQRADESVSMIIKKEGVNIDETILDYKPDECTFRRPKKVFQYFVKNSNLKSIRINNTIAINFKYSNVGNPLVTGYYGIPTRGSFLDNRPGHKLDQITVSGSGIPSKKIKLEYDLYKTNPLYDHYYHKYGKIIKPNRNPRPFLKRVTINNQEPYVFEYQLTDDLPGYDSPLRNKFGLYEDSSQSELNNFGYAHKYGIYGDITNSSGQIVARELLERKVCTFIINSEGEIVPKSHFQFRGNLAHTGLLSKIILPTKGTIGFEYVNFDYPFRGVRKEPIRVKKVIFSDGKKDVSFKEYQNVGVTYGELNSNLRPGRITQFLQYTDFRNRPSLYKAVHEKLANGASIYYMYSEPKSIFGASNQEIETLSYGGNGFNPISGILNNNSSEKGKLIAQISFDADGKPLSKTEYIYERDYDTNNNQYSDYIPKLSTHKKYAILNRIFTKPNFLRETRTYTFDPKTTRRFFRDSQGRYMSNIPETNNGIPQVEDIHKDEKLQSVVKQMFDPVYHKIKERTTYTEDHQQQKTTYTYPYNYSQANPVYTKMMADHLLIPVSKTTQINTSGVTHIAGVGITEFMQHKDFIVPYKNYQWAPNSKSLVSNPQLWIDQNGQISAPDYNNTSVVTYTNYTDKGIPYGTITDTGRSSYTVYDNLDQQPILNITNIAYQQLAAIGHLSETSKYFMNHFGYTNFLEYLRALHTYNPGNSVYSYLYDYNHGNGNPNVLPARETNPIPVLEGLEISALQKTEIENLITHLTTSYPYVRCNGYNYAHNGLLKYSIDSRNQKTFYEYDRDNRLITTKDNEGNIINHTSYNTKK